MEACEGLVVVRWVHLRGFAATVDNLRMACQPLLTLRLASVSEGWWT